ncbi:MAG: type I restriction endonuclease, partial [Bacteroidota bacterium]
MPNFISEDHIEQATISLFVNQLGYRHLNCMDADLTGRDSESEVVIKPLLSRQLQQLNPDAPASAIHEALALLCQTRLDMGDMAANKELYGYICHGVPLMVTNEQGREEPVTVRVMDFDHPENNDFLVVSQLWIQGSYIRRRPDLIVYVNGLPVVFIELKNSNVGVRNAYETNLTNYRHDIPLLFHYNAICMLSNGLETKVGSYNAGYEHFYNWLRTESEKEVPDKQRIQQYAVSLDYAVLG